jgi:uncharacterized protein YbaP (TraB family)
LFFRKPREKPFRMIWEVRKGGRVSHLCGTAHFFPYSFKDSLAALTKNVDTVLLEGPLDRESMAKVSRAGTVAGSGNPLGGLLDGRSLTRLRSILFPSPGNMSSNSMAQFLFSRTGDPLEVLVRGMKPWMAFFTVWTSYLEKRGWKYSVDLQAYEAAGAMNKEIVFLEMIEEQIHVLETLSLEKIRDFLSRAGEWDRYVKSYVKCYLRGDLEGLLSLSTGFPSRTPTVIEQRDETLFHRMRPYLARGNAAAFVGAPHVRGIRPMLLRDGYTVRHVGS